MNKFGFFPPLFTKFEKRKEKNILPLRKRNNPCTLSCWRKGTYKVTLLKCGSPWDERWEQTSCISFHLKTFQNVPSPLPSYTLNVTTADWDLPFYCLSVLKPFLIRLLKSMIICFIIRVTLHHSLFAGSN